AGRGAAELGFEGGRCGLGVVARHLERARRPGHELAVVGERGGQGQGPAVLDGERAAGRVAGEAGEGAGRAAGAVGVRVGAGQGGMAGGLVVMPLLSRRRVLLGQTCQVPPVRVPEAKLVKVVVALSVPPFWAWMVPVFCQLLPLRLMVPPPLAVMVP